MFEKDYFAFLNGMPEQQLADKIEKFKAEKNTVLRDLFKKFIKPNLLIRLKEEILQSKDFIELIKHNCFNLKPSLITGVGVDDVDYLISLNLAMIYWYLNLPNSNEGKSVKNDDENFISNLKTRVIFQCRLNPLMQYYNKTNYYLEHIPICCSTLCVVNLILSKLDERLQNKECLNIPNENFKINTMIVILKTIKSILLLVASDNAGSAFSLLRSVVEMQSVYFVIGQNEDAANEYYKFMQYRFNFEINGELPDEIENLPKNISKSNYLNYGWLNKITNCNPKKYVFNELLSMIKDKDEKDAYSRLYKYCCKYSHGNYLNQDIDQYAFVWILGRTGFLLKKIAFEFFQLTKEELIFNDINLFHFLDRTINEAFYIYEEYGRKNNFIE